MAEAFLRVFVRSDDSFVRENLRRSGKSSKVERDRSRMLELPVYLYVWPERRITVSSFVDRVRSRGFPLVSDFRFVLICLFSDGSREKPGDHRPTENRWKRPCLRYPKKVFPLDRSIVQRGK